MTKQKNAALTHKPTNTVYINTRQGRTAKKYTGRRATHNYCTQIKH
jgi:hypothetical protein